MTRFVLWGGLSVIAVALACFYPMGGQPLIGHIAEIYRSPVVQKKVSALNSGVEKRAQEMGQNAKSLWDKKDHKPRGMRGAPMSRVERDEQHSENRVEQRTEPRSERRSSGDDKSDVRERPRQESTKNDNASHSTAPAKLAPKKPEPIQSVPDKPAPPATAKDDLTEQDRDGLNRLLADKLRKGT